ncbi:MAG: class I SAM-dependent methyltransferase [Phycisphaerae bacterium]
MVAGDLAGPEYWSRRWAGWSGSGLTRPGWHGLLARHLPRDRTWRCLELGCVPGRFLVYLHREFGYRPAGLDYSGRIGLAEATLRRAGIEHFELHACDLFEFRPAQAYDVVCSFGLVEHFRDSQAVVRRHVELVRPGGYVVIEVPNFTHVQYFLRQLLEPVSLRRHQREVMNPAVLGGQLRRCGTKLLYAGMWGTFDLRLSGAGGLWRYYVARGANLAVERLRGWLERCGLGNCPTRLLSPVVLAIARRVQAPGGRL